MTSPSGAADLVVASWNIQYGIDVAGAIDALGERPELAEVDVLLLQEMDRPGVAAIASAFGFDAAYRSGSVHRVTGRDFGNAVLVRGDIIRVDEITLPHQAIVHGERRVAVRAEAEIARRRIVAVSVHTEIPALRLARRREQFAAVADAARGRYPVIVGGDFNTVTRRSVAAVDAAMEDVGLQRVSPPDAATLRRVGRELTLDHLYARRLSAVATGTVAGAGASDHRPIWARLAPSGGGDECAADA